MRRAQARIIDVLDTNMATQLTADAPSGLNVSAPDTSAYYKLRSLNAVRAHPERNHRVQVYVFPTPESEQRSGRSVGATFKSQRWKCEMNIALRLSVEAGAADYDNSSDYWKTLTPYERETERADVLLGAIQDCIDGHVRNEDDVHHVFFLGSTVDDDRFKRSSDDRSELWASVRFEVHSVIHVPVQQ